MLSAHLDQLKKLQDNYIVVGCSGGVDSIALSHWLISNGFKVHLVHINYHKRGESSNLDQQCVEEFAQKNGIPLNTFDYDSNNSKSSNFQESAREFRYEKFKSVAVNYPTALIALAHHEDDQIETFFMNLSRKSGVLGLSSMLFQHNSIVRPFLSASKNEILDYAKQHNLSWKEDESNSESEYTRNRWRNEFIPLLSKEIPSIKESVLTLISHFQSLQLNIEESVKQIVKEIAETGILSLDSKSHYSDFELLEIWRQLGQPATTFDSFVQLFQLEKGKRCELIGNYECATKESDHIYFTKVHTSIKIPRIEIETGAGLPQVFSKNEIYLDAHKLVGELFVRKWKIGDFIEPIGMKGRQLVSDIIKDAKIPNHAKNSIFVLCDDKNIHWVLGLKVGKIGIAEVDSVEVLKISVIY